MIDYEYTKYLTRLILDKNSTEFLFCIRFRAMGKLRGIVANYEKEGFMDSLVETIFCKKAEFIMEATTKAAIKEILEPSVSKYMCGEFYPKGNYHVEEEELVVWSHTSLHGPLIPEAQKRFEELFRKCMGQTVQLVSGY